MKTKSIAQWRESNKKLSLKNAYFKKQLPIVKGKMERLQQKLIEQEEVHKKELDAVKGQLAKEIHLH